METTVFEPLVRDGVLARVGEAADEERAWLDCDLASLAELRLHEHVDPDALPDADRQALWSRVTTEREMPLADRRRYEEPLWILEGDRRVGTVALTRGDDEPTIRLSSLYVRREARQRGIATRTLAQLQGALGERRRGFRLDTCWTWQATLRFYLRRGLWVRMWKRDLQLCWSPRIPAPVLTIGDTRATLSVLDGAREVELVRAERVGEALAWSAAPYASVEGTDLEHAYWNAESTLAVAIATSGWPLARSPAMSEELRGGDAGAPEALAERIRWWEAWEREQGWLVTTPRIPGLTYPSLAELAREAEARRTEYVERDGRLVIPRGR